MVQRTSVEPDDPVKLLLAILVPPLGVAMEVGLGGNFWLSILLTICGFIPGILHAVYVVATR